MMSRSNDIHIALIGGPVGCGSATSILLEVCLRISGIRVRAVSEPWDYHRDYHIRYARKYRHEVAGYADYRDLLAKERGLDAAIITSPDWLHAEQTNACLNAGLHVYCQPEMARTLAEARGMVHTARTTGKLLQIGRQRRSNPRYRHAIDRLIHERHLLGRLTHGQAQWHRSVNDLIQCPRGKEMDQATLDRFGYSSMREFLNWPWFNKYSVGWVSLNSSHQIDFFRWAFGVNPNAVIASGGVDFYSDRQNYDNVTCVLDFPTPQGVARASCQFLTTTRQGGFHESLLGENGWINISEVSARGNSVWREPHAPSWQPWVARGELQPVAQEESDGPVVYRLPVELAKLSHQPHLENFFDAIRGIAKLNCPAEDAFATAVIVFKINEAVAEGIKLKFHPQEFIA